MYTFKVCVKCLEEKPSSAFSGARSTCRRCRTIASKCSKYGIKVAEYYRMLEEQNYSCAICGVKEDVYASKHKVDQGLSIDHCHKTGKVRGLLCSNCNYALGQFLDNTTSLENAIKYLEDTVTD